MLLKRTPILVILFLTIIRIGVFYTQEIPSPYICPHGYSDHRGIICQCSNPNIHFDSISIKQLRVESYCPRGIHNFICQCSKPTTKFDTVFTTKILKYKYCPQGIHDSYCQCGPNRYPLDKKNMVIKKKRMIRFRKLLRLQ